MDRAKRLLARGYFPVQLPPCFTTQTLADNHAALAALLPPTGGIGWAPASRAEHFSVARVGHARRNISITNPWSQLSVARTISDHWNSISVHLRKSHLSRSRPILRQNARRATEIASFLELNELRTHVAAGHRYILRADVSRFFPTLYTHSIPWALHGKTAAKANRISYTAQYFGNLIDRDVRKCQLDQTLGIPIGPDTSHIISEIIATSVDIELKQLLKKWPIGYRHVDDYFLCFDTYGDAERALHDLQRALRIYELDLNLQKTSITGVDDFRDDDWSNSLRFIEISEDEKPQRRELISLFGRAIEESPRHEEAVKYAIKKSASVLIDKKNWDIYESYLVRLSTISPNCIPSVCEILYTYHNLGYELNSVRLKRFISLVVEEGVSANWHSEIVWLLALAKDVALRLPRSTGRALESSTSSVCALLALALQAAGLIDGNLNTSSWLGMMSNGLWEESWLLAYEAGRRGWVAGYGVAEINNDPHFAALLTNGVIFFDEKNTIIPLIKRVPADENEFDDHYQFEYQDLNDRYF